jgi:hypothetical protein
MRARAPPKHRIQRIDPLRGYGELTERMPNCGDVLRSEFGNSSVDRSKDIPLRRYK